MTTLTSDEREIQQLFSEGVRLKEIGRKSVNDIDRYLEAALLFGRAAQMSLKVADEEGTDEEDRVQHLIFAHYYSYEEHNSLGGYYYEKRQTRDSAEHLKRAAAEVDQAIALIENLKPSLSEKTAAHLRSFLPDWRHCRRHTHVQILATEARALWDSSQFIEALDMYREMARYQRQYLSSDEFAEISPRCQRVAKGNYIGMMMNASSAMAAAILQKTKVGGDDSVSEIPFDLLTKLVRHTLDAYRLANEAFDQNPEWDQYRSVAGQCLHNIRNFLQDNPAARLPLSIAFQDDPDFMKMLKMFEVRGDGNAGIGEKAKILFISANPDGTPILKLDEEMRSITQKIRAAEYRDQFEFAVAPAARPDDLLQAMNEHRPRVVHFSGHGSNADEIILCDQHGDPKPVQKEALVALFESTFDDVRVVLLNCCYSRSQAEAIVSVVPCAIGMTDTISDEAASLFAASFYRALAFGYSVRHAFMQGIAALKLEGVAEDDIPELLTRPGVDPTRIFIVTARKARGN